MSKIEVTGINLFDNPRYFCIFQLIKLLTDKKKIIRYKHLKYAFVRNHGDIDLNNKRVMKDINETLKFEEIDHKKFKITIEKNIELNTRNEETIKYYQEIKNIKDYGAFYRLAYLGNINDFIFKSKNLLSNTLNLLIKKREIIGKDSDKKGTYYFITDIGMTLFYRYYCKWYAENLPENKLVKAYKSLEKIAKEN